LTIRDFLINTPLCCPSRACILRGQYTHNHGVYSNTAPSGGFGRFYALQDETSTLATWLQQAGYRTALIGKYLNGYPFPEDREYIPPGWTEWDSPVKGTPYKEFGFTLNQNGQQTDYRSRDDYLTDVLARQADDFLRRAASDPQPFFLFLAPYAPHGPAVPAPRHAEAFPGLLAPRTGSFDEADVSDKPYSIASNPLLSQEQLDRIDELYRLRVQSMQAVDEMIAGLFATLQETGQLEDTYIIFTSDNGYHLGQHRLPAGKGTPYEEDILVPFIVRGPGVPAGQTLAGYPAGNVDIAPTIAELAGVVPPVFVDGRSMAPLLGTQPPADWRKGYLIEYYGSDPEAYAPADSLIASKNPDQLLEPPDLDQLDDLTPAPKFLALRTSQYLYAEYEGGFRELYDLGQDPDELTNIASSADPDLLDQLSAWLKALATCSGEGCRRSDSQGLH
jgi:arylsulfatase A-like enzyme